MSDVAADALHIGEADDATTLAAKRVLLLRRRDAARAPRRRARKAAGIRLGALDRGLAAWGEATTVDGDAAPAIRSALGL